MLFVVVEVSHSLPGARAMQQRVMRKKLCVMKLHRALGEGAPPDDHNMVL